MENKIGTKGFKGFEPLPNFYAVRGDDTLFAIVQAKNKDEAFHIVLTNLINDDTFTTHINSFGVNDGLLEGLFYDEHGSMWDSETGDLAEHILKMSEAEQDKYIRENVIENAEMYWEDHPKFAEEYTTQYLKYTYSSHYDDFIPTFSDEFKIHTFKALIEEGRWFNEFEITEFNLSTRYQEIYRV